MRFRHSIALVLVIALLPIGTALAQGGGGAASGAASSGATGAGAAGPGGGRGGVGTSSSMSGSAVGGGPPAGAVGGGAPAGAVGGGAPTSDAMTNSAPSATSGVNPAVSRATPTSPSENPPTTGGVIGGATGAGNPAREDIGGVAPSPAINGQTQQQPVAATDVRGVAEPAPSSSTGLSKIADDGVSTKIVRAKPCSIAAQETDGTTTCVGIPSKQRR
jgi:hypothetical protein